MSTHDDSMTPDDLHFEDAQPITFSDDFGLSDTPVTNTQTDAPADEPVAAPKVRFSRSAPAKAPTSQHDAPMPMSREDALAKGVNSYIEMDNDDHSMDLAEMPAHELMDRHDAPMERPMRRAPHANGSRRPMQTDRYELPLEERIQEDLKNSFPGKGILEVTPSGFGFLRPKFTPSADDIYVSQSQIHKFWLRPGDEVEGLVRPPKENEKYHGLLKIEKVNGRAMTEDESRNRKKFNALTSMYPDRQVVLETDPEILSTRIMDLFAPIGFGQRGMIVSPPKAGKTTLLKNIAAGILKNFPDAHLIAILIGERPEEVTDMTRSVDAEVVSSHFDQSPRDQIRTAEIGLERAKRLVEEGKDVVILLDSITRLARAYNMAVNPSGRTLSGGFDPAALYPAKKFLGAARNCEEGGSLTIIGTALVNTESRMDDLIYEEFKGTGNMELHLDRGYAEKRIYPAIDIEKSGTRHDELLISADKMEKIVTLRRMMALLDKDERITILTDKMKKTKGNEEFLSEIAKGLK